MCRYHLRTSTNIFPLPLRSSCVTICSLSAHSTFSVIPFHCPACPGSSLYPLSSLRAYVRFFNHAWIQHLIRWCMRRLLLTWCAQASRLFGISFWYVLLCIWVSVQQSCDAWMNFVDHCLIALLVLWPLYVGETSDDDSRSRFSVNRISVFLVTLRWLSLLTFLFCFFTSL